MSLLYQHNKLLNLFNNILYSSTLLLLLLLPNVQCTDISNIVVDDNNNDNFDHQQQQFDTEELKSNETGYFSNLWNTLTTTNKTLSCPGECVHAITSIFCDHVIDDIHCGGNLFRCCISNSQYQQLYSSSSSSIENFDLATTSATTTTTTETFSVISNNHHLTTNKFDYTNNNNVKHQSNDETTITTSPIIKTTQEFDVLLNNNNDQQQQQQQNSSIKTNPCPVQCTSLQNTFCMRPLHDAYCPNLNEECCLESESTFDAMTKNFIKLIQQTVAMNQTKNIGSEFQQHSLTSTLSPELVTPTIITTTTTTTTISPLPPCDGTCVVPLFHMLCDEIDHNQYCSHGYCCVNREIITTTTMAPIISQCDGTCLPVILSGMCTKPSELVLKTLDCSAGTICCSRDSNKFDFNNNNNNNNEDMQPSMLQIIPNYHTNQIPIPPRIPLPFRKNNQQSQQIENLNNNINNNKIHFRLPDILASATTSTTTISTLINDDNILPIPPPLPPQTTTTTLNDFICPGKCINSMFKFTCLGGYSISKQFKCSKGQLCCASNADIEKLEIFLHNTKIVQQQQHHIPIPSKPNLPPKIPSPPLPQPILQPNIDNNKPIVSIQTPIIQQDVQTIQQQKPLYHHQCGIKGSKRTQRVVGGSDSYPGEWCWQIAIVNQQNKYICGGVLIGKQWVLTAAHCVTTYLRKNEAIYIRAGEYDLKRNNRFGQMQKVQTIYVHHNHNSQSLDNDIALMKLSSPIELNPNICLVCLPSMQNRNINKNNSLKDKQCTVTGYGFQHESGPIALRIREALIPIVDDQECIMKINSVTEKQFILPASSFCAGGHGGNDACQGDGGSGLVCSNTNDNYYELTGLVSWGFGCGRNGVPGVYVKVISFIGWINQIVSTNS